MPGLSVVLGGAFLLAFAVSLARAFEMYEKGGDAYRVGDWLINYEGGFVRRGLLGQLLLWEGRAYAGTLLPFVLFVQVALYGMLLVLGYRLALPHLMRRASILLMALSPATFLFEALNPQAFRKELLGLTVLALFCHSVRTSPLRLTAWLWCLGLVVPALILSHEAMLLLLPYFLIAALLSDPALLPFSPHPRPGALHSPWSRPALCLVIVSSLIAFAAALVAAGDEQKVQDILESLRGVVPRSSLTRRGSHGSILALQHSASKAFSDQQARFAAKGYNYPIKYALIVSLSIVPFLANRSYVSRLWSRISHRWLLVMSVGLTIVLCLIAKDWGRFIYMNATALSLVLLSQPPLSTSPATAWTKSVIPLIYACVWRVPISDPSLEQGALVQAEACLLGRDVR